MFNIRKFRHVALIVKDYRKMIRFYSEILNFKVLREFELATEDFRKGVGLPGAKAKGAHLAIPGGEVELEIFQFEEQPEGGEKPSQANLPGFRHIALIVDDLKNAYQELKNKGLEFLSEPILVLEPKNVAGSMFVYFKDPEGNIIELNQQSSKGFGG